MVGLLGLGLVGLKLLFVKMRWMCGLFVISSLISLLFCSLYSVR